MILTPTKNPTIEETASAQEWSFRVKLANTTPASKKKCTKYPGPNALDDGRFRIPPQKISIYCAAISDGVREDSILLF